MTYGSLFAGVGGADLGFDAAGMECKWQCELDAQARGVLEHKWPDVPKVRDIHGMSRIPKRFGDWRERFGGVDVIVGGFPCTDLSVAGKREGLKGSRSGLFFQMMRVVRGLQPEFVVWENVPGLLSSDHGNDLLRVVRELADSGYFGCYRVLDAQFFGVPQRRRRVFGVFARGHSGAERCAKILALCDSLQGYHPTRGEAGEDVAGTLGSGSGKRGWAPDTDRMTFVPEKWPARIASTLNAAFGDKQGLEDQHALHGDPLFVPCMAPTITSTGVAFAQNQRDEVRDLNGLAGALAGQPGMKQQTFIAHTLTGNGFDASEDGTGSGTPLVRFGQCHSVRRLTPRECERLMGWPDDHTRFGTVAGKVIENADGPRYRMAGNGIAAPCAEWIGRRLMSLHETSQH